LDRYFGNTRHGGIPIKAEEKLTRPWLPVLALTKELGNLAKACRQRGMRRSRFDESKRRFRAS